MVQVPEFHARSGCYSHDSVLYLFKKKKEKQAFQVFMREYFVPTSGYCQFCVAIFIAQGTPLHFKTSSLPKIRT